MSDQIIIPGFTDWLGNEVPGFVLGDKANVYELCMVYTDRHPACGPFPNNDHNDRTIEGMNCRLIQLGATKEGYLQNPADREPGPDLCEDIAPHVLLGPLPPPATHMEQGQDNIFRQVNLAARPLARLAIYPCTDDPAWVSNELYQDLADQIRTRALPAKRVHLHDKPFVLDYTICVVDAYPTLIELARRRGDPGQCVLGLLPKSDARATNTPGPKPAVRDASATKMFDDLRGDKITAEELSGLKLDSLVAEYGKAIPGREKPISANTLNVARKDALTRFAKFQNSNSEKL